MTGGDDLFGTTVPSVSQQDDDEATPVTPERQPPAEQRRRTQGAEQDLYLTIKVSSLTQESKRRMANLFYSSSEDPGTRSFRHTAPAFLSLEDSGTAGLLPVQILNVTDREPDTKNKYCSGCSKTELPRCLKCHKVHCARLANLLGMEKRCNACGVKTPKYWQDLCDPCFLQTERRRQTPASPPKKTATTTKSSPHACATCQAPLTETFRTLCTKCYIESKRMTTGKRKDAQATRWAKRR